MKKNFCIFDIGSISIGNEDYDIHNNYVFSNFIIEWEHSKVDLIFTSDQLINPKIIQISAFGMYYISIKPPLSEYPPHESRKLDAMGYAPIYEADSSESFQLEAMVDGDTHLIFLFQSEMFIQIGASQYFATVYPL